MLRPDQLGRVLRMQAWLERAHFLSRDPPMRTPTFYGAALDAGLQDFRHAAGPYATAAEAADAALRCCAVAARPDIPLAPYTPAVVGDHFILEVVGIDALNSVIGPYPARTHAATALRRLMNESGAFMPGDPVRIGIVRFHYTLPSGMQAAVIEV